MQIRSFMDVSTVQHSVFFVRSIHRALSPLVLGSFLGGSLVLGSLIGCSGDTTIGTGPGLLPPNQVYLALTLNQHAVNLALTAPANTVQLSAIPLSAAGTPMSGLGMVHYHAADSTVTVDSTGLVTAHYVTTGGPAFIVASLQEQAHTVTHADTVFLQVTDTIPQHALASFSLQPAVGDSARRSANALPFLWPVRAADTVGTSLCGASACALQVYYTSSNPLVAQINRQTGLVQLLDTGHVKFTATTLAYGVARRDSVEFTVDFQDSYTINISLGGPLNAPVATFGAPPTLRLNVGAVVLFTNIPTIGVPVTYHPVGVVFDHPEDVDTASTNYLGFLTFPQTGGGNISSFGGDTTQSLDGTINNFRSRRFPIAGTYQYHSTVFPSATMTLVIGRLE